jgi:hypothetical protein
MFLGVFGVIIYGIGAVYLSQKILPEKYRLKKIPLSLTIVGIILLCVPLITLIQYLFL